MAGLAIQVIGAQELADALHSLARKDMNRATRKGLRVAANLVRDEARRRAPMRTGRLRRNITVSVSSKVAKVRVREGSVKSKKAGIAARTDPQNAYYARFLEHGTSKMAARPFMRPALDAQKDKAVSGFRDAVQAEINKVKGA